MGQQAREETPVIEKLLQDRILVLDGAMGTMLQRYPLDDRDYRGERLADHPHDVKGNPDILVFSRPDVIAEIHDAYLEAGADIIETNTFTATSIAQADYHLEAHVFDMNVAAARLARERADRFSTPDRPRFVAGSIGPTNRMLSMSPRVNEPAFRSVSFAEVQASYAEQIRGLLDGGCDLLLAETVFDTLNLKACLVAMDQVFTERGRRWPVMLSVTITDKSGRTLSGQTIDAFWASVAHIRPLSVGVNCALGAREMRPYVAELAALAGCLTSCHPNAGLPNAMSEYDELPATTAGLPARAGLRGDGQHRRRLLRHHARSHPRHRRRRRRAAPAPPAAAGGDRSLPDLRRPRDLPRPAGHQLRHGRRAHQRHRLRPLRRPHQEG
jgi:5-methyltetrahydrofolate--homocysteine methyltransferase